MPEQPARAGPRRAPSPHERIRDAERSRSALLMAALEEFSAKGFSGARVADIAARAGVNKQLINYYFGSKEGLYLALKDEWLEHKAVFAPPGLTFADLAARYVDDALGDPRRARLLLWAGLSQEPLPTGGMDRSADLEHVRRRQAAGEIADDLDPAMVVLLGMALVAAPIAFPQVTRELFGLDPFSAEFKTRFTEQMKRVVAHLAGSSQR